MAANAFQEAQKLFLWAKGNAGRVAAIEAAFDEAITGGVLTKGGTDSIISGTKNGVTMQKVVGLTESQRSDAISIARTALANNTYPSTRSYGRIV